MFTTDFAVRQNSRAFSLIELLIAAAIGSILLASLVLISINLYATAQATERYSKSQADQVRLIDYIARDLRMATSVGLNSTENPLSVTNVTTMTISTTNSLVIQVPDCYESNNPTNSYASYKALKPLYSYRTGVAYGTGSGAQGYGTVTYSRTSTGNGGFNYLRTENGVPEVIAIDNFDLMDVDIEVSTDGVSAAARDRVFVLSSYFISRFRWPPWEKSGRARVTSSDRIMLRNPRIDK